MAISSRFHKKNIRLHSEQNKLFNVSNRRNFLFKKDPLKKKKSFECRYKRPALIRYSNVFFSLIQQLIQILFFSLIQLPPIPQRISVKCLFCQRMRKRNYAERNRWRKKASASYTHLAQTFRSNLLDFYFYLLNLNSYLISVNPVKFH